MIDLVEVSKERFFSALKADPRDIMPRLTGNYPYVSMWETNNSARILFGKSEQEKYWLAVVS